MQNAPHEQCIHSPRCVRLQRDLGLAGGVRRHLCLHYRRSLQSRGGSADRGSRDRARRRARSGRGDQRHRLGYDWPSRRHDDLGLDLASFGPLPVFGHLVGPTGESKPGRDFAHVATRNGYSFHHPQQRHHRPVDRAGDAGDRRGTRTAAVSILVRRGVCLEYRRNGDFDATRPTF